MTHRSDIKDLSYERSDLETGMIEINTHNSEVVKNSFERNQIKRQRSDSGYYAPVIYVWFVDVNSCKTLSDEGHTSILLCLVVKTSYQTSKKYVVKTMT